MPTGVDAWRIRAQVAASMISVTTPMPANIGRRSYDSRMLPMTSRV